MHLRLMCPAGLRRWDIRSIASIVLQARGVSTVRAGMDTVRHGLAERDLGVCIDGVRGMHGVGLAIVGILEAETIELVVLILHVIGNGPFGIAICGMYICPCAYGSAYESAGIPPLDARGVNSLRGGVSTNSRSVFAGLGRVPTRDYIPSREYKSIYWGVFQPPHGPVPQVVEDCRDVEPAG